MVGIDIGLGATSVDLRAINSLMTSETEDVAKYIRLLAFATQRTAQALVGVRTGRLKSSIKVEKDTLARLGYGMRVVADTPYALAHHEGTRPHIITASPGTQLRFRGRGGEIFTRSVRHPGTRANPYLLEALRLVVR